MDVNGRRYLDLLKRCLTRDIFIDQEVCDYWWAADAELGDADETWQPSHQRGLRIVRPSRPPGVEVPPADWLPTAETMIGMALLSNIETLVVRALAEGTPGDLVETGVWRGGAVTPHVTLCSTCVATAIETGLGL